MFKKFLLVLLNFFFLSQFQSIANNNAKGPLINAQRMTESPKIDGNLDEQFWQELPIAYYGNFTQFIPHNGKSASFPTEIKIGYTDFAVYISAKMYDPSPDSILTELGLRDDMGRNADMFGVSFDTYNTGQNAFYFVVSAAGVQTDMFVTSRNWDRDWDAVWNSAVNIDEKGWVAELEIPYSAIRFPKQEIQSWGINFMRDIRRNREETYWSHIDNSINGFVNQFGVVEGIREVKPPTRLSFLPYLTAITNHDGLNNRKNSIVSGGMDLKYGINESYTMDISLIPDFSQVQSDNVILNLSPFEVRFNENRPFFTEGTELFDKGGLFYSRRVGQSYGRISGEVYDHETIVEKPNTAPMINAIKLSGRNSKGLGIGIFNAVTDKNYVLVENKETGEKKQVEADPLTNFSVVVVDKNLKNNSNVSVINTNVSRADGGDNANVTGTEFRLVNKANTYAIGGFAALSQIYEKEEENNEYEVDLGYKYNVSFSKISGKIRFSGSRSVATHNYDINDMGFMTRPNYVYHDASASYNIFKPFGIFNRFTYGVGFHHGMLYKPDVFNSWNVFTNTSMQLKNFWSVNMNLNLTPEETFDYFEPRVDGRVFIRPSSIRSSIYLNTDSRKMISLSAGASTYNRADWNQVSNNLAISPKIRLNDKLSFNYNLDYGKTENSIGYVTKLHSENNELENIVFGLRNIQTVTNTFGGRLIFSNKMG
ncbi:hypothetical protein BH23BAC1_BH23BAC1_34330 [soil metagenome]